MPLGTQTEVEEIRQVQNARGNTVAPASDEQGHVAGEASIGWAGEETVTPTVPGRASTLTVLAACEAAAEMDVAFLDEDGTEIVTRAGADVPAYQTDASGQIYATIAVASPRVEITFRDTTVGANNVAYTVMVV